MTDKSKTTVAIVGAGISGLSAAKLLNEAGIDVLVLEAHDRVGGRTYSIQNAQCQYCDLGGSFVGPTQDRILRMAKELGVETYKINEEEHLVMHTRGRTKLFKGAFPPMGNPIALMDINHALRTMDEYGAQIPLDAPWNAPKAKEWDQITFADFVNKITWTRAAKDFLYFFHQILVASEPHETSMLWFLYYVKRCDGATRIFATTDGGQERKMKGGSNEITKRIAQRLGDRVLLEHPVNKIDQSGSTVLLTAHDESKFEADYVILANAPALQQKITYTPTLPPLRNQVIQRVPMGTVIKTMMFFPKAFWIEKDMCGSAIIIDDDIPVLYALNDTKPDGSFPCLLGFINGDKARRFAKMSKEERSRKVAEGYAKAFKSEEALNFTHYEEKVWAEDPWTGGCYTAHFPPGLLTQYGHILREPVGKLYFAGTETANHWAGYMEGAVEAGERAAREVLFAMGKIRKDEIWQAEPMSKEVPSKPLQASFLERNLPSVPGFLRLMGTTTVLSGLLAGFFAYKKYIK